jgi:hypothetical protein
MNPTPRVLRFVVLFGAAGLAASGCRNIFVPKHKVLVDAIAAPGAVKPTGQSYRLVAKRSIVNQTPVQVQVVKACIDAALNGIGMFEAPPNVPPDLVIEVGFGQDSTPRVDPSARETYIQLSARANPDRSLDRATGQELWDVKVAVLGVAGRIETAMPLLTSVAANYIATDTRAEARIDVPQNSPSIAAVRDNAIKALDAKPTPAPESAPPAPAAAPGINVTPLPEATK